MSMLSGQADKLRKEAQNMRDFGRYEMEQMLLDADDTILQLRDDLQRVNAENAKLLKELEAEHALAETLGHYHELEQAENAKLRKFVLTLAFCANDEADCDQCPMNGAHCDVVQQCFCDGAATALREMGIEVD